MNYRSGLFSLCSVTAFWLYASRPYLWDVRSGLLPSVSLPIFGPDSLTQANGQLLKTPDNWNIEIFSEPFLKPLATGRSDYAD
jgi:hypothetical protein